MAAKKVYDVRTKVKAIRLSESGVGAKEICGKMGLHPPRLYAWLKKKVEIMDEYEDVMLKKFGDRGDLTVDQAEALDAAEHGETPPPKPHDVERLLVENDLLRDELTRMRETVINLRVKKWSA